MQIRRTKRKAVAPVLATLMMIAVAVAMSVIIFVWSQGFLSQTSSAAGGQQSQQNLAAESGLSLETAILNAGTSGTSGGSITMVVRNVGTVSITIGSITIQGIPTNTGFQASDIFTSGGPADGSIGSAGPWVSSTATCFKGTASTSTTAITVVAFGKGNACTITITGVGTNSPNGFASGDSVNVKVTTTVGTFANSQYTVP